MYKVAAVWNDGLTQELKTYFLSCESCLAGHFKLALEQDKTCRVAEGETISPPEIHERVATDSGTQLRRRPDLEAVPTRR